jgi:ubiquinone/menaquinone biosynthesis C-methylase UbiE
MKAPKAIIDEVVGRWYEHERAVEVPFTFEHLPNPPSRVLDVGCVGSSFLACVARLGFDAYGIDQRDKDPHDYGPPYEKYPKFIVGDGREMPFEDDFFDAATAISTIEHAGSDDTVYVNDEIRDDQADMAIVSEMARVLKPGGTLIVTIPYGTSEGIYAFGGSYASWVRIYDQLRVSCLFPEEIEIVEMRYTIYDEITKLWYTTTEPYAAITANVDRINSNLCIAGRKVS